MDLNNINLNSQQVASWYEHSLVGSGPTSAPMDDKPQPVRFLGKNGKQILLLVDQEDLPFLPDQSMQFLTNILSACKLSMADAALVNVHHMSEDALAQAMDQLQPTRVIMFNVTPERLGLPMIFPPYQVQSYQQKSFVHGPSLDTLENNKEAKMKLWAALKILFGL